MLCNRFEAWPAQMHSGTPPGFLKPFLLKAYREGYREFNANFQFCLYSYYESLGARVVRTNAENLSRPTVAEIYQYRQQVDAAMRPGE